MKKIRILILLSAVLILAGCGNGGSGASSDTAVSSETSSQDTSAQTADQSQAAEPQQGENTSAQAEISKEQALETALKDAEVSSDQAYNIKIETDGDNSIPIYDIEFETDYGDYDYEIAIHGGKIVGADYEVEEEWVRQQNGQAVTTEEAKNIVADKVSGVSADEIQIQEESEDGEKRYEGRLQYDSIVYEFEMDAATGIIFDWNADLRM